MVRLTPAAGDMRLEALSGGVWRPVCDLAPGAQLDADFVPHNWFTSTHPKSAFRQRLIVSRVTAKARYVLVDNRLTIRGPDGTTEQWVLNADELERSLANDFHLPVELAWRGIIERAVAFGASTLTVR